MSGKLTAFHILTVLSAEAEASQWPSSENLTLEIAFV